MKRTLWILLISFAFVAIAVAPASAQKSQKKETSVTAQGSIKDMLSQYVGKTTNLGKLTKVTSDYFVFEEDGATVIHPLSTVHTIKLSKDEESGDMVIEIRLVGKD